MEHNCPANFDLDLELTSSIIVFKKLMQWKIWKDLDNLEINHEKK